MGFLSLAKHRSWKAAYGLLGGIVVLVLVAISTYIAMPVSAQDKVVEPPQEVLPVLSDPALELTLTQYGQEYPSKSFPVTLTVNSKIDSNKVGVFWNYQTSYLKPSNGLDTDVISVSNGNTTTFVKYFDINEAFVGVPAGLNKNISIGVSVRGFVANKNYISTKSLAVVTNSDMEVLPITDEYQSAKTQATIFNIIKWIVILILVVVGGFFGVKRFLKYLNSEEE